MDNLKRGGGPASNPLKKALDVVFLQAYNLFTVQFLRPPFFLNWILTFLNTNRFLIYTLYIKEIKFLQKILPGKFDNDYSTHYSIIHIDHAQQKIPK